MREIELYLQQHGWDCLGDEHWYHAERNQTALDTTWAMYYELKAHKDSTLEFLKGLQEIPAPIKKIMGGV